jgi:ankyrin repeat protein
MFFPDQQKLTLWSTRGKLKIEIQIFKQSILLYIFMSFTVTQQTRVNAILAGQLSNVKKYITRSNVNSTIDTINNTSLHIAVMSNNKEIIQYLLMIGANGKLVNKIGETSDDLACRYFVPEYFSIQNAYTKSLLNSTNEKLTETTHQLNLIENKYEELNEKYNIVLDKVETLKNQNEFYKLSNDASNRKRPRTH